VKAQEVLESINKRKIKDEKRRIKKEERASNMVLSGISNSIIEHAKYGYTSMYYGLRDLRMSYSKKIINDVIENFNKLDYKVTVINDRGFLIDWKYEEK
jgi:hypothetical protein